MARKARRASRAKAKGRAKAAKVTYMCAHCGYKSSKAGMHCGTECVRC